MVLGDIITAPIQSTNFVAAGNIYPTIAHATGMVVAVAYSVPGSGRLSTFLLNANGGFVQVGGATPLRNPFNPYSSPVIAPVEGEVYAIPNRNIAPVGVEGFIDTVRIPADGTALAYLNGPGSFLYDDSLSSQKMIPLDGSTRNFALFYTWHTFAGRAHTFNLSANGLVYTPIASFIFKTSPPRAYDVDAIHIAGNVYAIVYRTVAGMGTLTTVSIPPDGTTLTIINTLVFEATGNAQQPHIIPHTGDIYVISHTGPLGSEITTVSISSDGVTLGVINNLPYAGGAPAANSLLHIGNSTMFVVFHSGWVYTVNISEDGVTLAIYDSNNWVAGTNENTAVRIPGTNIYAHVGNRGAAGGFLSTFRIDSVYLPTVQTGEATGVK